mmetsp:Transcript_50556/g.134502  ORF Transcript_50556/g.134502 Transcript_50556/m.134502 type:complete len:150 (+) Transcript_50556:1648-2097(+)
MCLCHQHWRELGIASPVQLVAGALVEQVVAQILKRAPTECQLRVRVPGTPTVLAQHRTAADVPSVLDVSRRHGARCLEALLQDPLRDRARRRVVAVCVISAREGVKVRRRASVRRPSCRSFMAPLPQSGALEACGHDIVQKTALYSQSI